MEEREGRSNKGKKPKEELKRGVYSNKKMAQAEKEAERMKKTEAKETKRKSLELQKRPLRSRNKENIPESDKARNTTTDRGDQNECSVCLVERRHYRSWASEVVDKLHQYHTLWVVDAL